MSLSSTQMVLQAAQVFQLQQFFLFLLYRISSMEYHKDQFNKLLCFPKTISKRQYYCISINILTSFSFFFHLVLQSFHSSIIPNTIVCQVAISHFLPYYIKIEESKYFLFQQLINNSLGAVYISLPFY